MIRPIKIILQSIKPIKIYMSDLPKFLDSKFKVVFAIKTSPNLHLKLGAKAKASFGVTSSFLSKQICKIYKPSQFTIKSNISPKIQSNLTATSQLTIQTYVNNLSVQKLQASSKIGFTTKFKASVNKFIKHAEINNKKLSEINQLTLKDLQTIEIK